MWEVGGRVLPAKLFPPIAKPQLPQRIHPLRPQQPGCQWHAALPAATQAGRDPGQPGGRTRQEDEYGSFLPRLALVDVGHQVLEQVCGKVQWRGVGAWGAWGGTKAKGVGVRAGASRLAADPSTTHPPTNPPDLHSPPTHQSPGGPRPESPGYAPRWDCGRMRQGCRQCRAHAVSWLAAGWLAGATCPSLAKHQAQARAA